MKTEVYGFPKNGKAKLRATCRVPSSPILAGLLAGEGFRRTPEAAASLSKAKEPAWTENPPVAGTKVRVRASRSNEFAGITRVPSSGRTAMFPTSTGATEETARGKNHWRTRW